MTYSSATSDVYYLAHPDKALLPLAAQPDDLITSNTVHAQALVPRGTRVFILEDAATTLRILIAHGKQTGTQGWVPAAWVRVPQRYDQQSSAA